MKKFNLSVLLLLLLVFGSATIVKSAPKEISFATLLQQQTDVSQLPRLRDWTSELLSSYDRTGDNHDLANFISRAGNDAVLADLNGPGAVVRIWTPGPWVIIRIYIDNNPLPVIDTHIGNLFNGNFPPFVAPLAQNFSGGYYSYLPIPYAKHCRITVHNVKADDDTLSNFYHQVNYLTFPKGTPVRSFTLPLSRADQTALDATVSTWKTLATVPALPLSNVKEVSVPAGQLSDLGRFKGCGVVRVLGLQVPTVTDAELRQLVLRAYFDGHALPDIEAPVADFFGNAYGRKPFSSLLMSQDANGLMTIRFPMPFGKSARFTLENGAQKPVQVRWQAEVVREKFHARQTGYFHAQWSQAITQAGTPYPWAKIQGQHGHFVGIVQTMNGGKSLYYLEGDEQFRIDNQSWKASQTVSTVIGPWNGMGTEDIFNGGYYFNTGVGMATLNGLLVKDEMSDSSRMDMFRWFINDAPVFQNSMDAQMEHGQKNDAPNLYYSSVAYWYADGSTRLQSAMPNAASIRPPLKPMP